MMLGIVSGAVAPPVVKSVLVTVALQVLDRPPRSSVTVTAPICPETLAVPDTTEPRFDEAGALIVRVPPVIVNVTVVSSARAGRAVVAARPKPMAAAATANGIRIVAPMFK